MIPWTWLGMTIKASSVACGKWFGMSSQQRSTIRPASLNRISPSTTSPNKHARSHVTMVTKYVPGCE